MTYKKASAADLRAIGQRLYDEMSVPVHDQLRALRKDNAALHRTLNEMRDRVELAESRYNRVLEQFAAFKRQVLESIAESENRR